MHRENIKHIITQGTQEQMHEMREVFEELISHLKVRDHAMYQVTEYCLHKIAHNGHLGEHLARHWVSKMKNKDGSCGEHWSWDQVGTVMRERNIKHDHSDFYATLNMVYSDDYNSKFDIITYVDLARSWLEDEDVGDDKLLKYYFFVVCGK